MTLVATAFYETDWFKATVCGGIRLRLHACCPDPLRRRELASDLRIALLSRLRGDGLIGEEKAYGGD